MRLVFNILFFLCFALITKTVMAESFKAEYTVSTKGLKIGIVVWDLKKNTNSYRLKIDLKSKGLISSLYKFEGSYVAEGLLINGDFLSKAYSQKWITKKKKRNVKILFIENKVHSLFQEPEEKESQRIKVVGLQNYSDTLTSILKLLNGNTQSKTIDCRRVYVFSLNEFDESLSKKSYIVNDYINIWADHKRNDLEKISIINKNNNLVPDSIYIKFKGQLFKVVKN